MWFHSPVWLFSQTAWERKYVRHDVFCLFVIVLILSAGALLLLVVMWSLCASVQLGCTSLELICLGCFVSLCVQFLSSLSQFLSVWGRLVSPCSHFLVLSCISLHSVVSLWGQFDIEILTVTSNSGRMAQGASSPFSNAELMLSKQQMLAINVPIWLPLQPSTPCVLRL